MYTDRRRKKVNQLERACQCKNCKHGQMREKDGVSHSTSAILESLECFLENKQACTAKTSPFPVTGHIHKGCMCSERIQKERLKNMLVTRKFRNRELSHYESSGGRACLTLTSLMSLHRFFIFVVSSTTNVCL